MKKLLFFPLLFLTVLVSGCTIKAPNGQSNQPALNPGANNSGGVSLSEATTSIPVPEQRPVPITKRTYSNEELGVSFNYPKEWPRPIFIAKATSDGSYFDSNDQWEIRLGDLYKNSGDGTVKYFLSIRGFYKQEEKKAIAEINSLKNKGSLSMIEQFKTKQAAAVVYGEPATGAKNIMLFGKNGEVVKIQSIDTKLDADMYGIARTLDFFTKK
jgi:hypothetical protein